MLDLSMAGLAQILKTVYGPASTTAGSLLSKQPEIAAEHHWMWNTPITEYKNANKRC